MSPVGLIESDEQDWEQENEMVGIQKSDVISLEIMNYLLPQHIVHTRNHLATLIETIGIPFLFVIRKTRILT